MLSALLPVQHNEQQQQQQQQQQQHEHQQRTGQEELQVGVRRAEEGGVRRRRREERKGVGLGWGVWWPEAWTRDEAAELHASCWYHGSLSWSEAAALLGPTSPGTFLLRDSSDPRAAYSLSVRTRRGPLSVRVNALPGGLVRLDGEPNLLPAMPVFQSVVALVQHYGRRLDSQLWLDWTGALFSEMSLARPLYRRDSFPSLQHLARLQLNRSVRSRPPLPPPLEQYLRQYPYVL